MCENENFTERAKAWVKAESPEAKDIYRAYKNMSAKVNQNPDMVNEDVEACLEFLTDCYEKGGGNVDDIFAISESASPVVDPVLDLTPLCAGEDVVVINLTPEEKRKAFDDLRHKLNTKL